MSREDLELAISQRQETEIEKRDGAEDQSLSLSDLSASSKPPSALRADPQLPFLEMAWSPSQMQEFLNRQVLPSVWLGQEVTAVAIEDMSYKPGKQCGILYTLQFSDPTSGQFRRVGVTFANENTLGKIYRHYYGGESSIATGPTPYPVMVLPKYGCLVEFFPRDWKLPFLTRAMEPREIASLLFRGSPEAECTRGLPQVEVLRYRLRKRCVLRYIVEAPDRGAPTEVIGKVYKSGAQAVQGAQTQNTLHAQAAAYGLIIPKPLRVVQEWGFLLMERVPGTVMQPLVKQARTPQELKEVIGLAAATLVSLHHLRFESQEVQSLQTHLENLRRRAALLHLVAPLLVQQVEALLQQIARASVQFTAVALSFLHGDFSPGQLLMDEGQIGVIDFDLSSLGDPAIDVGNFMASLHYTAVCRAHNAFRQLAMHFLAEYQARLPENRVAERVHLFLSAALIKKSLHAFERWPYNYGRAGPDSLPVRLLEEAATCLSHH